MKDNFLNCLTTTLKWEGGYTNHPLDPGGPTNLGIIQERYDQYNRDRKKTLKPVKLITQEEAIDIYRKYYWDTVRGDEWPAGIDLVVFDFGVNSGPSRALKLARSIPLDKPETYINIYMNEREKFLKGLKTFKTFGKGWMNRTKDIRNKALELAGETPTKIAKELVIKNSTKLSVFQGFRRFGTFLMTAVAGIFSLDYFNLATDLAKQLQGFMSDYAVLLIMGSIAISWIVLKWGEYKHILDFKDGRYTPSGLDSKEAVDVDSNIAWTA